MTSLIADFRYALRRLIKEPGFAFVVTVVLGLGIGANSTVFSIVQDLLLPNLPIQDQNNVVLLWSTNAKRGLGQTTVSPADFADLRSRSRSFSSLAVNTGTW